MMMFAYIGSPSQWFILLLLCLLIFGAKRLPDIARALGRSLGEFRKARREFEEELMRPDDEAEGRRRVNPVPMEEKPGAAEPAAPPASKPDESAVSSGGAPVSVPETEGKVNSAPRT